MPDASSIIATLAAIKNSMDVVKAVKEADYDLDKAILKEKIAILIDSLLEAKIEASETLNLVQEKENKISRLENLLKFKSKLVRHQGMYYEADKGGSVKGEPYCSKCWEADNLAIHLKHIKEDFFVCLNCKNNFDDLPESMKIKPATSGSVPIRNSF
jgi:hypothetical protein